MNQWNASYTHQKKQKFKKLQEGYISYNGTKLSLFSASKQFLDSKFINNLEFEEGDEIETDGYLIYPSDKRGSNDSTTPVVSITAPTPVKATAPVTTITTKRKSFVVPSMKPIVHKEEPQAPPVPQQPTYIREENEDIQPSLRSAIMKSKEQTHNNNAKNNVVAIAPPKNNNINREVPKAQPSISPIHPKPQQKLSPPIEYEDDLLEYIIESSEKVDNTHKNDTNYINNQESSMSSLDMLLDDVMNDMISDSDNTLKKDNDKKPIPVLKQSDENIESVFDCYGIVSDDEVDNRITSPILSPPKTENNTPLDMDKSNESIQLDSFDDGAFEDFYENTISKEPKLPIKPIVKQEIKLKLSKNTSNNDMVKIKEHKEIDDFNEEPIDNTISNIQIKPIAKQEIKLKLAPKRKLDNVFQSPLLSNNNNKRNQLEIPSKSMVDNIPKVMSFPNASILYSSTQNERYCEIQNEYSSLKDYILTFSNAIIEDINIELEKRSTNFFQGCLSLGLKNPNCTTHGKPSQRCVTKNGPNKGKEYFKCSNPRDKCNYYLFASKDYQSTLPQNFNEISLPNDSKLTLETENYFQSRGVSIYFNAELYIKPSNTNNNNNNNSKQINNNINQNVYFLKITKKKFHSYAKDDIWIISNNKEFSNPILFRSIFHGPSQDKGLLEVRPIIGESGFDNMGKPKILSKFGRVNQVYVIHGPNISTELSMIDCLNSSELEKLPLLPFILNPNKMQAIEDIDQDMVDPKEDETFFMNCNYLEGLQIANQFIKDNQLNIDQKLVLLDCLKWFHFKDDNVNGNLQEDSSNPVILVHGVFGSGKSTLLVVIILFILSLCEKGENEFVRIFISSHTNVAVDRILLTLLEKNFTEFLRVGSVKRVAKPVLLHTVHGSKTSTSGISTDVDDKEEIKELTKMIKTEVLTKDEILIIQKKIDSLKSGKGNISSQDIKTCKVVGSTCAASLFSILNENEFPIVFLDECSQMEEILSMIPLLRAKAKRLLLVGDPQQLEPTIKSKPSQQLINRKIGGLEKTLFVRLSQMNIKPILLKTQYRCHPSISKISNELFYSNKLIDGINPCERPNLIPYLPPVLFIEAEDGKELLDNNSGSYYNDIESNIIIHFIDQLIQKGIQFNQIGVVCLYKAQATKINDILEKKYKNIKIDNNSHSTDIDGFEDILDDPNNNNNNNDDDSDLSDSDEYDDDENKKQKPTKIQVSTVDAFQGAERDIILLSCSRTTSNGGFIDNSQRLNVAITRAKNHFVTVGCSKALSMSNLWKTIINNAKIVSSKPILSSNINNLTSIFSKLKNTK